MTKNEVIDEYNHKHHLEDLKNLTMAKVVLFLAGSSSDFMTGQAINVTGGVYMT